MPRVSVIIPTYNRRAYVQEAIDSVLAQTYTDYEIIVVDDGSTDGTGDALQERRGDRIRYVWQENQGESVARNKGIEMAHGEFIALLDSDDLWAPEKLQKQVAYLDAHCETGAVICQGLVIDEQGNLRHDWPVLGANMSDEDLTLEAMLTINTISSPSSMMMMRYAIAEAVGGFDPEIRYGEDWDFCIRMRACAPIAQLAESLCYVRHHYDVQCRLRTWDKIEPTLKDRLRIIEKSFALVSDTDDGYRMLRRRVTDREYSDAAMAALAWGQHGAACLWLPYALDAVRMKWTHPSYLGGQYAQLCFEAQMRTGRLGHQEFSAGLSGARETLSSAGFSFRQRAAFVHQALLHSFFARARQRDWDTVRWVFPRLLLASPRWALNVGVWSISLEAFLGEAAASRSRGLVGAARVRRHGSRSSRSSS